MSPHRSFGSFLNKTQTPKSDASSDNEKPASDVEQKSVESQASPAPAGKTAKPSSRRPTSVNALEDMSSKVRVTSRVVYRNEQSDVHALVYDCIVVVIGFCGDQAANSAKPSRLD